MYYIYDSRSESKADVFETTTEAELILDIYFQYIEEHGGRVREQMVYGEDAEPKPGWSNVFRVEPFEAAAFDVQVRTLDNN